MNKPLDLAGVGIGPFNLSIAALIEGLNDQGYAIKSRFFDAKPAFDWHPGMMLPDVYLQTSYLKDLVTAVAPTNGFSFLNYLVQKKRFYQFLSADQPMISRMEYADYLSWAAAQLPQLTFNQAIEAISFDGQQFLLHSQNKAPVTATHLCLGSGKQPSIPGCAKPFMGSRVIHGIDIAQRDLALSGLRVAVIGGGQSGAEIFKTLIENHWGEPATAHWISRRPNFEPLDETAFTNELFTPDYVETFYDVPAGLKPGMVASQKLASDGISPVTLKAIYQNIYRMSIHHKTDHLDLRPNRQLVGMTKTSNHYQLQLENAMDRQQERLAVDLVIFATGFESALPEYLQPLSDRLTLATGQDFQLKKDFQVSWDGPASNRIYAVNAGRHSHGIAEPQMSLMSWRSATIINSLLASQPFDLDQGNRIINWQAVANLESIGYTMAS